MLKDNLRLGLSRCPPITPLWPKVPVQLLLPKRLNSKGALLVSLRGRRQELNRSRGPGYGTQFPRPLYDSRPRTPIPSMFNVSFDKRFLLTTLWYTLTVPTPTTPFPRKIPVSIWEPICDQHFPRLVKDRTRIWSVLQFVIVLFCTKVISTPKFNLLYGYNQVFFFFFSSFVHEKKRNSFWDEKLQH